MSKTTAMPRGAAVARDQDLRARAPAAARAGRSPGPRPGSRRIRSSSRPSWSGAAAIPGCSRSISVGRQDARGAKPSSAAVARRWRTSLLGGSAPMKPRPSSVARSAGGQHAQQRDADDARSAAPPAARTRSARSARASGWSAPTCASCLVRRSAVSGRVSASRNRAGRPRLRRRRRAGARARSPACRCRSGTRPLRGLAATEQARAEQRQQRRHERDRDQPARSASWPRGPGPNARKKPSLPTTSAPVPAATISPAVSTIGAVRRVAARTALEPALARAAAGGASPTGRTRSSR